MSKGTVTFGAGVTFLIISAGLWFSEQFIINGWWFIQDLLVK